MGVIAGLSINPPHHILRKLIELYFSLLVPLSLNQMKHPPKLCIAQLIIFANSNGYTHLNFGSYDYPYVFYFGDLPFNKKIREEYIIDLW